MDRNDNVIFFYEIKYVYEPSRKFYRNGISENNKQETLV